MAFQICYCLFNISRQQYMPLVHNGQFLTQDTYVLNNVSRKNDNSVFTDFAQNVVKTIPFLRVESSRRFIDDQK